MSAAGGRFTRWQIRPPAAMQENCCLRGFAPLCEYKDVTTSKQRPFSKEALNDLTGVTHGRKPL